MGAVQIVVETWLKAACGPFSVNLRPKGGLGDVDALE